MVLSEILSTTFLFSVAIVLILVGGLFAYFNHRFTEQNHKFGSMMELISTMAQEIQFFRSKLNAQTQTQTQEKRTMPNADILNFTSHLIGGKSIIQNNLIDVSDDDASAESEEDLEDASLEDEDLEDLEDLEEESEADDDSESEADDDDSESDDENLDDDNHNVKNITIDLGPEINIDFESDEINTNFTKTISLTEETLPNTTSNTLEDINLNKLTNNTSETKVDYSKLSLNKLREIVVEKGISADASKLKKNDILKLLA
jgi:hypothetical protein